MATLFKNIAANDRPFNKNIYYNGCDKHQLSTNERNDNHCYEVLHKHINDDQYTDPDNPATLWNMHEDNWIQDDSNKWVPSIKKLALYKEIDPFDYLKSHTNKYAINKLADTQETQQQIDEMNKLKAIPMSKDKLASRIYLTQEKKQSDSGANTNATNQLSILHDVVYIDPVSVNSATDKAPPMQMKAVGNLHLKAVNGEILKIACYYSPDVTGTIISPDAIARQHKQRFKGFRKICDCQTNTGYLILDAISGADESVVFGLKSDNNLWYHEDCIMTSSHENKTHNMINKLSTAANYELWHQRLCHPGANVMQIIHKHANGVPTLRGNSFYKCPSCMLGKCNKSYHLKSHKQKLKSLLEQPQEEMEIDDIFMPQALPGQHFHFDFGFMRTKHYQEEDSEGNLQTSVDGKNAYLLVVDRATRYMWVYLSSSKQPPIEFCKGVLHKFKAATSHRTVRCDQGELASSIAFNKLLVSEGYTLEITGAGNSKQNGMVERPHRTLANMVRCVLHSSGLGPAYWSYA